MDNSIAYKKIVKVIFSCTTEEQFEGAYKMITNFLNSKSNYDEKSQTYSIEENDWGVFGELLDIYLIQRKNVLNGED